jgi:hypothetical protein
MTVARVLDRTIYRRVNWRFVIGCWIYAIEELLRPVALIAGIAVAVRWLAHG